LKRIILFCFFISLTSQHTYAQRGGSTLEQSPPTSSPLDFFSGYFDTGMVPKKRFTLDLLLTAVDYGVTEDLTIGTNSASSILTLLTFQPYLFLKARYRFFSNKNISSVITGYSGYFNFPSQNQEPEIKSCFFNMTNNTSYFINNKNILNFHITALKFSLKAGDESDLKYYKITLDTVAFGLGYQSFFTDNFGLEGQFLYSPYFNLVFDNPNQQTSFNLNTSSNSLPFFFRILINYKTGQESNLSLGIWNLNDLISGPWLGWQVLF